MKARGPFPTIDTVFNTYVKTAWKYLQDHETRLQIPEDSLMELNDNMGQWNEYFPKSQDANLRTATITGEKNNLLKALKEVLRKIYADMPQRVLTTEDRNTLHITERSTQRTPAPVAKLAPGIEMRSWVHLLHTLSFFNPIEPSSRQMPEYQSIYLEIFVGPPNMAAEDIEFTKGIMITRFIARIPFVAADVNKTAYYRARYQNTRGVQGPPSYIFRAAIA